MQIQPYILIGGNSTRFGQDKASFEFEGEALALRAARVCETAFPDSQAVFVSKADGSFLDRRMIGDVFPGRGAAGAIHAALADAASEWIFILACDLPRVPPEFIPMLAKCVDDLHGCVVPVQPDGRWQPLCAFYDPRKCVKTFEMAITEEGKHSSLRAIIETVEPRVLEFSEYASLPDSLRLLTNVNSIADLESI